MVMALLLVALWTIYCLQKVIAQKQKLEQERARLKDQIDHLRQENILLRYQGREYTVLNNLESRLLGCPPVFRWADKEYRPVVFIEFINEKWKLTLIGADIFIEDWIGDDDCRLVVMHCLKRISAEEYDDLLRQLESGLKD